MSSSSPISPAVSGATTNTSFSTQSAKLKSRDKQSESQSQPPSTSSPDNNDHQKSLLLKPLLLKPLVPHSPRLTILIAFLLTKALYILLILFVPLGTSGKGYDTSTELLLSPSPSSLNTTQWLLKRILTRLTRWDSIYFVKIAEEGWYSFEQEWAFGIGWVTTVSVVGKLLLRLLGDVGEVGEKYVYAFSGALINNLGHLGAAFLVFEVGKMVFGEAKGSEKERYDKGFPLIAALLYVLSPAGIFLVAPYSEGLFAFVSFLGYWIWVKWASKIDPQNPTPLSLSQNLSLFLSAIFFSLATTIRSNGILNTLLFLSEFISEIHCYFFGKSNKKPLTSFLFRLSTLSLSSLLILVGFIYPQYLAYKTYCIQINPRPWCSSSTSSFSLPSIYTFVQSHYWNVGFLRYWTLSNIPLFLLAMPMITVLLSTAMECIRDVGKIDGRIKMIMIPQLVLALLAITNYHIQIITRVGGSGCFGWCLVSARWLVKDKDTDEDMERKKDCLSWKGKWLVRWMVVYAAVQAVLFVGFLPPA